MYYLLVFFKLFYFFNYLKYNIYNIPYIYVGDRLNFDSNAIGNGIY